MWNCEILFHKPELCCYINYRELLSFSNELCIEEDNFYPSPKPWKIWQASENMFTTKRYFCLLAFELGSVSSVLLNPLASLLPHSICLGEKNPPHLLGTKSWLNYFLFLPSYSMSVLKIAPQRNCRLVILSLSFSNLLHSIILSVKKGEKNVQYAATVNSWRKAKNKWTNK